MLCIWYVLPAPILLKSIFQTYAKLRLFALCFPYFHAMQNICELWVKAMFIMFSLFLGYLNSKSKSLSKAI